MTYDEIATIFLTPTDQPSALLGEPASSVVVVVSAFGVFEPGILAGAYEAGRSLVGRDNMLAARAEGAAEALDSLVTAEETDAVSVPLMRVIEGLDGLDRPLFAALRELPQPATAGGRLWRAAELVREHRGDGHLASVVAAGLDAVEANVLTELDSDGSTTTLTAGGRAARVALEEATDLSQAALVAALGADIDEMVALSASISEKILAAGWFPSDPRKRAGG